MRFLILILFPFFAHSQAYISMQAAKTDKPALHLTTAVGGEGRWIMAEGKMMVPLTNQWCYPAYFLANAGGVIHVKEWNLMPIIGYGYAMESNDYKQFNHWCWNYSVRAVHRLLTGEISFVDNHLFISFGVIGYLKRR